ncbi:MAG: hypothetical protein ACLUKN_00725 [Bacilli bacterium]
MDTYAISTLRAVFGEVHVPYRFKIKSGFLYMGPWLEAQPLEIFGEPTKYLTQKFLKGIIISA